MVFSAFIIIFFKEINEVLSEDNCMDAHHIAEAAVDAFGLDQDSQMLVVGVVVGIGGKRSSVTYTMPKLL